MDSNLLILLTTEQARCHDVARHYTAMGSIGCFAAAMLDEMQRRADHAIIHGQEADIRTSLTALQAVRQPPQTSSASFLSADLARRTATEKPSLVNTIASVGRRIPRLSLARTV